MSTGCQKTLCQYVNMSVCQYVRMQLFSLGIKIKVVQNVIRMSESHNVWMSVCQKVGMARQLNIPHLFVLLVGPLVVYNVHRVSWSNF